MGSLKWAEIIYEVCSKKIRFCQKEMKGCFGVFWLLLKRKGGGCDYDNKSISLKKSNIPVDSKDVSNYKLEF